MKEQTPLRILLADDVAANRRAMKRLLSRRDCEISLARDGQEALEQLSGNDFDVVLLDLQMPVLDGYQTVRAIRESEQTNRKTIPVIAMSARGTESDRRQCTEAGFSACVSKPVNLDVLFQVIEQFRGVSSQPVENQATRNTIAFGSPLAQNLESVPFKLPLSEPTALSAGNETSVFTAPAESAVGSQDGQNFRPLAQASSAPCTSQAGSLRHEVLDREETMRRIQGDETIFALFVEQFETQADSILAAIESASHDENIEHVIHEAHRLRGIAGNLGAKQLQQITADIEQAGRAGDIKSAKKQIAWLPVAIGRVHRELDSIATRTNYRN